MVRKIVKRLVQRKNLVSVEPELPLEPPEQPQLLPPIITDSGRSDHRDELPDSGGTPILIGLAILVAVGAALVWYIWLK